MNVHVHVEEGDDWVAVFVNGKKVASGHAIYAAQWCGLISALDGEVIVSHVYHENEYHDERFEGVGVNFERYARVSREEHNRLYMSYLE